MPSKGIPAIVKKQKWKRHTPIHWTILIDGDRVDYWPTAAKYRFLGVTRLGHPVELFKYVKPKTGPKKLAQAFCDMDEEQQREFFREVVNLSQDWAYNQFDGVLKWVIEQSQKLSADNERKQHE